MTPEDLKKLWVEKLRSGEYEQGRFCLQNGGLYCCLGVLCDIVDPEGWDTDSQADFEKDVAWTDGAFRSKMTSPDWLQHSAAESVVQMNDDGASFNEIADYIEAHVDLAEEAAWAYNNAH